jgi:hypothetical protein
MGAVALGIVPRRYWSRLDPPFPMTPAAFLSGTATVALGLTVGIPGYFTFATQLASANNNWMLRQIAGPATAATESAGLVPYGMSVLTLFIYVFFTPSGLMSTYVVASGFVRAVAGWFDDPHGDLVLTLLDWLVTAGARNQKDGRLKKEREALEGPEAPDVLKRGRWAGLDSDLVLLSSRRKPEWDKGAIVMSGDDWYRLGAPFDMKTPAGLRTAYPLTMLQTVEVVRRGIVYRLPPLR